MRSRYKAEGEDTNQPVGIDDIPRGSNQIVMGQRDTLWAASCAGCVQHQSNIIRMWVFFTGLSIGSSLFSLMNNIQLNISLLVNPEFYGCDTGRLCSFQSLQCSFAVRMR